MDADRFQIKEKALELFSKISFAKTSVADIAAACGLGKGTIYLHFQSKDEILFSIIEERIRTMMDSHASFFEDPTVDMHSKIERFFEFLVDEYFALKDLIFGGFESVRGSTLQEVFKKCSRYYAGSIDYLFDFVHQMPPWSRSEPQSLRSDLTELMELIVGRMLFFLIWNDWSDKEGLKAIITPLAARLFDALVGHKTTIQEDLT